MSQEPISKFWMVWNVQRSIPAYRHFSKASAQTEAKRLASQVPGELFVVLAAVDAFIGPIAPVECVKLRRPTADEILESEIPF